ncbi:PAS domain-containing protein [Umboniibacter marinipuniceus]|uniref:histidine kinase n=1 Tax=Umboniibacter marinipuniceus TaxID=569599 RepID=A0A3M0AG36_9GAMM|nr:PAS domain S-box protein [Umboniibacter marinipuniceus]RMA82579.1 PAS domain S-box-containing protein [Umboniibacter marinipuniceus]
MQFVSDYQLAMVLAITLWAVVGLGTFIISVFVKRLVHSSVLCIIISGASLAACYSLGATAILLTLAFFSTIVLIGIGFLGLFLSGSQSHFQLTNSEDDQEILPIKSELPADFPSDLLTPFLLEGTICGIYIFDVSTTTTVYVNSQFSKITGFSLEELKVVQSGLGLLHNFHRDDLKDVEQHIQALVSSKPGACFDIHCRYRHRDGSWIHCLARDIVIHTNAGKAKYLIGTFVDVSQLHQERAELDKLSARYSATFEYAPVGIAHVSLDGKFLRANSTLKKLLGYSDTELDNLTLMDITHPDDLKKDLDLLNSLIEGEIPRYKMDKRYFNARNQVIWIELTVAAVRQNNGEVDYFISIIRDITHHKLIAHELKEANSAFTRFVTSSPFLLEQPIAAIGAMAARIENKIVQRQKDEELLFIPGVAQISKVTDELTNRLNNLLDLVRFNPQLIQIENASLEEIIKFSRTQTVLAPGYPRCRVNCDENTLVPVDRSSFVKLISHLTMNIEQMRTSTDSQIMEVNISCYPEEWHQRMVIELRCTGFELTPEFKQLMLRAYDFQDENQLDEVGLRFAIIRQIVRAHKGQLNVDTDNSDGFSMTIALPTGTPLPN